MTSIPWEPSNIRPKKKYVVFPVTLPTPIFGPYPKVFIKIFLFFIKSYIMLFVWSNQVAYNVDLDNLYDFLHWKHSKVPLHYLFILMITTMNTCKYPEIKFISFLIFSQYQMRIKIFIKIKTFSYLPTQIFFRRLPETHIFFLRPNQCQTQHIWLGGYTTLTA